LPASRFSTSPEIIAGSYGFSPTDHLAASNLRMGSRDARESIVCRSKDSKMIAATCRLRKHADYQRVYSASRKQFGKQMSFFFQLRPAMGADGRPQRGPDSASPRVGLTVGKVMGNAVVRNRIKRRMREAVRKQLSCLKLPLDVVLHPRRSVIDLEFPDLEREVASVFRTIQKAAEKQVESTSRRGTS
jgi:ribonuclease P protein component